jgi:hypothetical protein
MAIRESFVCIIFLQFLKGTLWQNTNSLVVCENKKKTNLGLLKFFDTVGQISKYLYYNFSIVSALFSLKSYFWYKGCRTIFGRIENS